MQALHIYCILKEANAHLYIQYARPLRDTGTARVTSAASSLSRKPAITAAAAHSAAVEENEDDQLEYIGEPVDVSEVCYRTGTADGDQLNMLLHAASGYSK